MTEWTPNPHFEEQIRQAFHVPEVRPEFVDRVYGDLMQRTTVKAQTKKTSQSKSQQHALRRWTWAAIILALVTLLVIYRQPVMASIGRVFGYAYFPETGFINLDQVRVLENAVTQEHEGQKITARRGLVDAHGTEIWLEFSEGARPIDDAWLETPTGQRFELLNWNYSPDETGSHGIAAYFPPVPDNILQTTLILPEGWHLPLTWIPGNESNLTPANIILQPTAATTPEANSAPAAAPETSPCAEALHIRFCVEAAARTETEMQVLVSTISDGGVTPGMDAYDSMFAVPGEEAQFTLEDETGNSFPMDSSYIEVNQEQKKITSTLHFHGAQDLTGRLQLNIPAVLLSVPLSDEIRVDLGENPQPGQTIPMDKTVLVQGMPVHFSQAELVGEDLNRLTLSLTSDFLDDSAAQRPYHLQPGRPDGIGNGYGSGIGPDYLSIHVQLFQQSGLKTGMLRIPLIGATLKVRGPFILSFNAPASLAAAAPEPQVVEDSPFAPLPVGEQLSMEAYRYNDRPLQSGDLLTAVIEDDHSTLYAASPGSDFTPQPVAVLPGQVLAVSVHPDYQGIDYLTGEYLEDSSIYRQLYTLRFEEDTPRLLINQFERSAFNFGWSYDGRFLAYKVTNDLPGQAYEESLHLIDLNCRASGECSPFTTDTRQQGFSTFVWSPAGYQIAMTSSPASNEGQMISDIYIVELDPDAKTNTFRNLTQSPSILDFSPVGWTSDGETLYYPCWTGETDINEYSLCRSHLSQGADEVVVPLLPWNMHTIHLAADRWVVDRNPVLYNGLYSLRAYDLQKDQNSILLEWPVSGKYWMETYAAPDGRWIAIVVNDLGGLLAINIESHESIVVQPNENGTLHWVGWVK